MFLVFITFKNIFFNFQGPFSVEYLWISSGNSTGVLQKISKLKHPISISVWIPDTLLLLSASSACCLTKKPWWNYPPFCNRREFEHLLFWQDEAKHREASVASGHDGFENGYEASQTLYAAFYLTFTFFVDILCCFTSQRASRNRIHIQTCRHWSFKKAFQNNEGSPSISKVCLFFSIMCSGTVFSPCPLS